MTLLVALKSTDGIALAADSRGTFGDPRGITAQNDSQQKARVLAPHVAVLQAGTGDVGTLLIQEVTQQIQNANLDGVTPVMEVLRSHSRQRYNEWFPSVPAIPAPALAQMGQTATRPDLVFIVAGYEVGSGGADAQKLYSLGSQLDFSPMLHDYGFAVQGVAQYALYLLNRLYEPGRTVQEMTALAAYVITETASQDGKVGGPVNLVTISEQNGCVHLSAQEVENIIRSNEARSRGLKGQLL
ncbi:MAG TPA: hypothetical protein VFZ97_20140 [Acidimicrobiales bacterium]